VLIQPRRATKFILQKLADALPKTAPMRSHLEFTPRTIWLIIVHTSKDFSNSFFTPSRLFTFTFNAGLFSAKNYILMSSFKLNWLNLAAAISPSAFALLEIVP